MTDQLITCKLTQDLMELFVEYQVPSDTSDLLSYNGHSESAALEDKIANVKANAKAVMDAIESQNEKQLKDERAKADMLMNKYGADSPNKASAEKSTCAPVDNQIRSQEKDGGDRWQTSDGEDMLMA